jgi:molybdate transport system permease protein
VLSVSVYNYVENNQYAQAHVLAAGMLAFAFAVILAMRLIDKRMSRTAG